MEVSSTVQAAIIAAIVTAIVFVLRDVLLPIFQRQTSQKEERIKLYEVYALPLAEAARDLFYRLKEIVVDKRSDYLGTGQPKTKFDNYKYVSTLYRMAALIGWIRAIRREQSYLAQPEMLSRVDLHSRFVEFEMALADGPHVEVHIVEHLCRLWSLDVPADTGMLGSIATKCNGLRNKAIATAGSSDVTSFGELAPDVRLSSQQQIAEMLSRALRVQGPHASVMRETQDRATHILSPRQAWIYRDWQKAIGDSMLQPLDKAQRRFEVIGYHEFEARHVAGDRWLKELEAIVSDLNFDVEDPQDFRPLQIRRVLNATADLIIKLDDLKLSRRIVDQGTVERVKEYREATSEKDG